MYLEHLEGKVLNIKIPFLSGLSGQQAIAKTPAK
jgi:hypothetical protein